jgi:DNA-binding transcriptional LysR family regulator
VKKSVGAGLGIAFVSQHAVSLERQARVLVTCDVAGLELRRGIYLVRRASFHLAPLHQRFLAALG